MRVSQWDVPGVMGWNYSYNHFNENTGRVTYAQNRNDATLDRSYDYDNVGRLLEAHTGSEARGALIAQGGAQDGPYSHSYRYDQSGNMWYRVGWGGSFGSWLEQSPSYTNNRITTNPWNGAAMSYDNSGNLTNDSYQSYNYDATGQQTYASTTALTQAYDGDTLRVKKVENSVTTYYLRSSVLGGQVVAEMNSAGGWTRGFVYLGGQMLALQGGTGGQVSWVHQDPVTKSQRVTNSSGAVTSTIDLDPWGGETSRSNNAAFQPRKYTTYERDANGGDEAMMRRYQSSLSRFSQPDPYDGSYSLSSPQSLNRYAYVHNDPVNFIDPTGLDDCMDVDGNIIDCYPDVIDDVITTHTFDWFDSLPRLRDYPQLALFFPPPSEPVGGTQPRIVLASQTPTQPGAWLPPCNVTGSGDISGSAVGPFGVGITSGYQLDNRGLYGTGGFVIGSPGPSMQIMGGNAPVSPGLNASLSFGSVIGFSRSANIDGARSLREAASIWWQQGTWQVGGTTPAVAVGVTMVRPLALKDCR